MELRQLEAFYLITCEGSFTRAAAKLHITQPSITARIQALENELGCQLMKRKSQGIELTSAGKEFLFYVEQALNFLTEGAEKITCKTTNPQAFTMATTATIGTYCLPGFLTVLKTKHPLLKINLKTANSEEVLHLVDKDSAAVGFINLDYFKEIPHYITNILILEDPTIFVTSRYSEIPCPLSICDLNEVPLIAHIRDYYFWRLIENYLQSHNVRPNIIAEADNFETIKEMTSKGFGASFVPLSVVREEINTGKLIEIPIEGYTPIRRQINLIYKGNRMLTPHIIYFLQAIRHYFNLQETPRR